MTRFPPFSLRAICTLRSPLSEATEGFSEMNGNPKYNGETESAYGSEDSHWLRKGGSTREGENHDAAHGTTDNALQQPQWA